MDTPPESKSGWTLGSILGWGGGFTIGLASIVLGYLAWQYPVFPQAAEAPAPTARPPLQATATEEVHPSAAKAAPTRSAPGERIQSPHPTSSPRPETAAGTAPATTTQHAEGVTITQIASPNSTAAANINTVNMGPHQ
jgi:hypothetical protein